MPVGIAPETDAPGQAQNFRALNDNLEKVLNEVWVPASAFGNLDGVTRGAAGLYDALEFSAGADKSAYASLRVWPWWSKGTLREISLWVVCLSASSGNVVWRLETAVDGDGDDVAATNSSEDLTVAAPTTADELDLVTGLTPVSVTASVTRLLGLRVHRLGTSGADTAADAMQLIGLSARFFQEARR